MKPQDQKNAKKVVEISKAKVGSQFVKPELSDKAKRVVEVLNLARSMELHAIHQYMNQHYNLDDMDYGEFAATIKRIAIDEMNHAEDFAERIKELGGEPGHELAAVVVKGQKLNDIYPYNIDLEGGVLETYNKFLAICRDNNDTVSVKLFESILQDEQKHYDYFDKNNDHIIKLGDSYLSRIAGTSSDIGDTVMGFVDSNK